MDNRIENISQVAYSFKQTLYNSYDSVTRVISTKIEGDLVECGVAAGSQIACFQLALMDTNEVDKRKIWAFDSFEGIPLAGEKDDQQPGIGDIQHDTNLPLSERLVSSGITCHSLESVLNNFKGWNLPLSNIKFVKGWFQNTIEEYSKQIDKISVLRLDGDLYESTYICLEHLYPKISKGGVLIIDDYALTGCRLAVEEYFKDNGKKLPTFESVDNHGVVYTIVL
jgi:hypothetical protein